MRRTVSSDFALGFGEIDALAGARESTGPKLVILARWVLVLAVVYTALFNVEGIPPEARHLFVASILLLNLLATWALRRSDTATVRWGVTVLDVVTVTAVMVMAGNATGQFFLAYLIVLSFAALSHGSVSGGFVGLGVTALYGSLLYAELGAMLWVSPEYLIRLAFLFGMGFFLGTVAEQSKSEQRRARNLEFKMRSFASHAKHLARDKYRLRALSEIGRLGLTGEGTPVTGVLFDISKRVQNGVGVDRCSLVVLDRDGDQGFVAASGDDPAVEVRVLEMDEYPELQETFENGEITEVHPNRPPELWQRICRHLPDVNPFSSFLVVPIKVQDTLFGVFYLRDHDPDRTFDEEERDFCWAASMMTASYIRGRDLVEQLREQSRVDGLTGLLNFQAFTEEAQELLESAGVPRPMSLVVIDMDNLKAVNDRNGHMAGNMALVELGRRLREALPTAVSMCRYGGDEFVALVSGDRDGTAAALESMLNGLTTMEWDEPFQIRASIGVAEYPADGDSADALLEAADQAMYLAKSGGGHRVRLADASVDQKDVYDAVVSVQTRRVVPDVVERFNEEFNQLQRRIMLGLQSPVVKQSIDALMQAVELKDPHSEAHSRQVSELCRDLATALGLREEQVLCIEIAGYLHDVGKIKLPADILTKQGSLSPEERAVIERAPDAGARILEALPGLRTVAKIVRTYHERWDGSGYPQGLSGDEIPLGAQIVGICDVYNALVSDRAQRPALEPSRARQMIEQEIGRLWNPRVAQVFLEMLARRNSFEAGETDVPQPSAELDDRAGQEARAG